MPDIDCTCAMPMWNCGGRICPLMDRQHQEAVKEWSIASSELYAAERYRHVDASAVADKRAEVQRLDDRVALMADARDEALAEIHGCEASSPKEADSYMVELEDDLRREYRAETSMENDDMLIDRDGSKR